ncbi:hypothetical protein DV704_03320 [Meiothermus sp. QL-1]|uniref:hypothetical protein n=1 Tax=Meiothermus sp. QL-1 TaxID=2058095 RepID=UPI000E0C4785|nr:hypothetical protein [Meiothermus sp. QL-1]RDI95964.1 hypothetical protein DV704_03320 [Meiothermus sp. QL-1]
MLRRAAVGLLVFLLGVGWHAPQRTYTATGQVVGLVPARGGCWVRVRLHQWVSLSEGFGPADIPQRGQVYALWGGVEECTGLEVALADQTPAAEAGHIYYKAGQLSSGAWWLLESPTAPVGCAGP